MSHTRYKIFGRLEQRNEILKWCDQTFGPSGRNKKRRWRVVSWITHFQFEYTTEIEIRNKQDLVAFLLRWPGSGEILDEGKSNR